jgi:hypothetical protein
MNKIGLGMFIIGLLFIGFVLYDHYKNPQYYRLVKIDPNNISYILNTTPLDPTISYYHNSTDIPKGFMARFWFYRIMLGIAGATLFFVLYDFWLKNRDKISEALEYEQENKKGVKEKGDRDSEEKKEREDYSNSELGGKNEKS